MSQEFNPPNPDPLEAELASLRAGAPSPGLSARLARELGGRDEPAGRAGSLSIGRGGPIRHPARWFAGVAAGLAAAVVVAASIRHVRAPKPPGDSGKQVVVRPAPSPPAVSEADGEQPITLAAYRSALAKSPEALDELLSRRPSAPAASPPADVPLAFGPAGSALAHATGVDGPPL